MVEDEDAVIFCVEMLRCVGLSATKIRKNSNGNFAPKNSALSLVLNGALTLVFTFAFFRLDMNAYGHASQAYKTSTVVYPFYTKLMMLAIVVFAACGNFYNRTFASLLNGLKTARNTLEENFGHVYTNKRKNGLKILISFLSLLATTIVVNLLCDAHLVVHYDRIFRVVHYLCFCHVTLFSAHFALTMNLVRESFEALNAALRSSLRESRSSSVSPLAWMKTFVKLQELELLVNRIFGKQIFLTFALTFSSVIVNAYYFILLNLNRTSYVWLNVTILIGFSHSMLVALANTVAVEAATRQANQIKGIIFHFLIRLKSWEIYNQVKIFEVITFNYPIEFKAWIFYTVNYDSLLKVILTSSAITAIILQCDSLRGISPSN